MKSRQNGMATVLILIFVGMALGASVLGASYYVKSMQEQQNTALTATQAQMRAWQGLNIAEAVFLQMTDAQRKALANAVTTAPQTVALNGIPDIQLQVMSVDNVTTPTLFNIEVTGKAGTGTRLGSSSKLAASLVITPGKPATPPRRGVIMFNSDLKLGGSIKVTEGNIHNLEIIVNGNVETSGNSIENIKIIRSTKNITVTSGSEYGLLHANGDVTMSGSTRSKAVLAGGNISISGSGYIYHAAANGNISMESNTIYDLLAGGSLIIRRGGASIDTGYQSKYKFDTKEDGFEITTLPQFDLANGYTGTESKPKYDKVNKSIDKTSFDYINTSMVSVVPGLMVNVPRVSVTPDDKFDAYDYKKIANYAFTVDNAGYMKVAVRRVAGLEEGDYFIGEYGNDKKDYLCKAVTGAASGPSCTGPAPVPATKICTGYSDYNNCFSYNAASKVWTITGKGIAPGVAWFEGGLILQSGTYYNTFFATTDFKTNASITIYAPNYAAFSGTQKGVKYAPAGYCNQSEYALKPAQFCGAADQWNKDVDGGIGNFSVLAGSKTADSYQGGNITFGASSDIYGSIWAGNLYGNSGDTTIHGYITALALNSKNTNSITGSTNIILNNLPDTLQFDQSITEPGTPGTGTQTTIAKKWVRYI